MSHGASGLRAHILETNPLKVLGELGREGLPRRRKHGGLERVL